MYHLKNHLVLGSIIIGVILFLLSSGTLTSGYHFVDDHEIVKMKSELKSNSFFEVSKKWVEEDVRTNTRFRPFYYVHRVFETKLFGSDLVIWSIYHLIIFCIAVIFIFLGMKKLEFTDYEAAICVLISFAGSQISVLWRLGPGEGIGMALLGVSLYYLAVSNQSKKIIHQVLFVFFLILASLTKESFLIIIPAMIFLKIWHEKEHSTSSYTTIISRNWLMIIPFSVLLAEILIIKFYVGTGYAGLGNTIPELAGNIMRVSLHFIYAYSKLIFTVIVLTILIWFVRRSFRLFSIGSLIFFLLILIPNIILYSNYGLIERYLLPSAFGLGFFIAAWIKTMIRDNPEWLRIAVYLGILLLFISPLNQSIADAKAFAVEGRQTKELLPAISENFVNGNQAMVVADPVNHYELSVSLKTYLLFNDDIRLYGFPLVSDSIKEEDLDYVNGWKQYFEYPQDDEKSLNPELIIFLDKSMSDKFFEISGLNKNDYLSVLKTEKGSQYELLKKKIHTL